MTEFAHEYGAGLYELAREEKLTCELLQQLRLLRHEFEEQPEFIQLLSNRALGLNERLGIIDAAFSGSLNQYLVNFLKLLCGRDAMHEFGRCTDVYTDHFNRDNNVSEAVVITAKPLTEAQAEQLKAQLEKKTGHEVVLTQKLDESVLGGAILEMDGKRWDNTVRQRLESIRQVIADN